MDISNKSLKIEQLSPNHKRSLSGSDTLPPRMEMGDSSNIGYGQSSTEVVDTSEIQSHSQEISSPTGLDPPGYPSYETLQMDRYLSDDLENKKESLERRSYTKVIPQEHCPPPDFESDPARPRSLPPEYYDDFRGPRPGPRPRPVSPPLRSRYKRPPSLLEIDGSGSRPQSVYETGSYQYEQRPPSYQDVKPPSYQDVRPPSYQDVRMDDFENDNNSIPAADLASSKPHFTKPEHVKNTNEEVLSKEKDNRASSAQLDDVYYTRASNVTLSNFVSVKLSGKSNYHMWKAQMECLMKSHKMRGLVIKDKEFPDNMNTELRERYEILLNGWLIGSLSEEIIKDTRIYDKGAKGIWDTLEQSYDPYAISPTDSTLLKPRDKKEKQGTDIEPRLIKKLQNATLDGHWWKAISILNDYNDKGAATWKLNVNHDTLLHAAVRLGNNYFLKKLLDVIHPGKEIETVNSEGHTALHIAAIVGNKEAAELLVGKRKELLLIKDNDKNTPLACANFNKQVNVFVYLSRFTKEGDPQGSLLENKEKEKENENEKDKDKRKEKENVKEKEKGKEEGKEKENEKEGKENEIEKVKENENDKRKENENEKEKRKEEGNDNEKEKGKKEGKEYEIEKEKEKGKGAENKNEKVNEEEQEEKKKG